MVSSEKGPIAPTTKECEKNQAGLTKVGGQSEHIEVQVLSMLVILIQLKSCNGLVKNRTFWQ
jgi:hypothetical protein